MTAKLPGARADLIPGKGPMAPEFYRYFAQLQGGTASSSDLSAITDRLNALQAEINALPDASGPSFRVLPPLILTDGILRIVQSPTTGASGRSLPQSWVFT